MKILMIGDIYAKSGREMFAKNINKLINDKSIDFVIVNGENVSHGKGLSKEHYEFLKANNVDVITSGNHIFKNNSVFEIIDEVDDLLKPANMNYYTPGSGFTIIEKNNKKICVLNMMGTTFMEHVDNPYEIMDDFLDLKMEYDILMVDFHAEATAEKIAFALNYDGIITGFSGTHTHVQTADERILPNGTAFITDLGMTGVIDSVIGANKAEVIYKEKTGLPSKFKPATGPSQMCGAIFTIDDVTNKAIKIERVNIK